MTTTDTSPSPAPMRRIAILLVEDNPGDARLFREELAESGASSFEVTHVARLDAALALAGQRAFDLILLDLHLPDSRGFETFLRMKERSPGVPIVVLSGLTDATLGIRAVHEGAQDYLMKGDRPAGQLERTIRYAVERAGSSSALRESEERYRQFFEEDLAGAFIISPEGRILACNPAFVRMFGFPSVEAAIGRSVSPYFPTAEAAASLRDRIRGERALRDHEFILRRSDRTPLHVIGNLVGRFSSTGDLVEIKGYLFDDSERKRLEEELRQSQKMESIGRLAGGIAHDFNNLLTAILGYSDLLLANFEADDPRRAEVDEIRRAGQRAAALTSQLLAFSRRQVLQPRVLDLNAVVVNMKSMLQRLLGEDVELVTGLADACRIKADAGQIEQVIVNLSINARDAMPSGGVLTIASQAVRAPEEEGTRRAHLAPGDYAVLSVKDTGNGIEEGLLPHLFEPFFTTKELGKGTGLGLSTVYGIVKQSGGEITVESEIGRGSIFRIYLPVVVEKQPAASPAPPIQPRAIGSETILLVEDESAVRAITRRLLQASGYLVLEASGGAEALELCDRYAGAIDLLLTDLMMPQMSGREVAERIGRTHPRIRLLFMSGYTEDSLARKELAQPGAAFLQKPFSAAMLARKVRETLDIAREVGPQEGQGDPLVR